MAKDYSDIPGERDVFVLAWKILEKYRHVPRDSAHLDKFDEVAADCMNLATCADQYGGAAAVLAKSVAHSMMGYYGKLLEDVPPAFQK